MGGNERGKFGVEGMGLWAKKAWKESSRVWAWIKFVEISGVCGRGKFEGMWAWEVRGKFGCGVNKRKAG